MNPKNIRCAQCLQFLFVAILFCFNTHAQNNRVWGSYYGGAGNDQATKIITDGSGNTYLTGKTSSTTGIASGGFQNTYGGGTSTGDAFLAKFDAAGNRLWATYYGGPGEDEGWGIAIDKSGNVFLAGWTQSSSGIASSGFQNTFGGGTFDAFLVKFNASGNLLWGTYYGGAGTDQGLSIATDKLGNVYLIGTTASTAAIASGGFQNTYGGGTYDMFMAKFDGAGNRVFATYYGGPGNDDGEDITLDGAGNIYLTGATNSVSGIASGGFQNTYGGSTHDAYLVKLDAAGNRLWATYYGGSGSDISHGVAVDTLGNVFIGGNTTSTDSIASGGFQNTFGGGNNDGFLAKFNTAGNRLWGTYYGGTDGDSGLGVATDLAGNIYLAGLTTSASAIASGGFQNTYGGIPYADAFLARFNATGNLLCATYYGGTDTDAGNSISIDPSGNVFLAGAAASTAGIASGGFQNVFGGVNDAFLVKLSACNSTGVNDISMASNISIYPNPTNGIIYAALKIKSNGPDLSFTNILGEDVLCNPVFTAYGLQADLSSQPNGVYFIHIKTGDGTFIQKIIKN
jgi:hypothetical protein